MSHPSIRSTAKMFADSFILKKTSDKTSVNAQNMANFSSQQYSQAHAKSAFFISTARWSISLHPRWHCRFPVIFELVHSYLDLYWSVFKLAYLVSLSDASSKTFASKLIDSWISMFGFPTTITTDRGSQFTSSMFRQLSHLLGSSHVRTTAYHPSANGLVERFHRQLDSERLSIILLEIRNTI